MSALTEKIKKFFNGWGIGGAGKKAAQPGGGQESKRQEEAPQPSAGQPVEKPEEQQPGS